MRTEYSSASSVEEKINLSAKGSFSLFGFSSEFSMDYSKCIAKRFSSSEFKETAFKEALNLTAGAGESTVVFLVSSRSYKKVKSRIFGDNIEFTVPLGIERVGRDVVVLREAITKDVLERELNTRYGTSKIAVGV